MPTDSRTTVVAHTRDSLSTSPHGLAPAETWLPEELEAVARCPVCGSSARTTLHERLEDRFFGTRGLWTIRCCALCRSGYLDPRPTRETIGRAYNRYYTHEGPDQAFARSGPVVRTRRALRNGYLNASLDYTLRPAAPLASLLVAPFPVRRHAAKRLVSNLPYVEGGRLLDVGCGNGGMLRTMRWAGWRVEGVEPDAQAAATARASGLTVHEGPFEQTSLPAASFDAIVMHHVLEHMPMPLETLQHCRRLLRPGGLLWAVTPNLASAGYRTYSMDWVGLEVPRHLVLWNPHSLEQALESADFDVAFLQPLTAGSMLRESAKLQAQRLGVGAGRTRALRIALRGRLRDLRALRDPTLGEELVVLARPRGH